MEDVALRRQCVPISAASTMDVHDEVENERTFRGPLPHDYSAAMPRGACHVMSVEILARLEGIEDRLDLELVELDS